jgi:hypothetical protein
MRLARVLTQQLRGHSTLQSETIFEAAHDREKQQNNCTPRTGRAACSVYPPLSCPQNLKRERYHVSSQDASSIVARASMKKVCPHLM